MACYAILTCRAIMKELEVSNTIATLGPETDFPTALKGHPGLAAFGVGRELRNISSMLSPGEYLLDILQGQYSNQTGVLLRTTTRLIFFGKGLVSTKVEEFPLDKVSSVQYSTGMLLGELTIFASGNRAEIKGTVKAHTKAFADGLRDQLAATKHAAATASAAAQSAGTMGELEKLASLKERGLLSDEEFTAAKRKILGL
jgi:hypothetical protein